MANGKDKYTGVQFEMVRRKVDPQFETLHDELSQAYYKHWRQGESFDWHGRDPIKEGVDAKTLFDQLHGNLWNEHSKTLIEQNDADGKPYADEKINPLDDQGVSRLDALKAKLADDKAKGIDISALIVTVAPPEEI